mmetsp:Transcript_17445/g.52159  ORF Transcript_17445/g.52159 Transcript_17445/m.52159 type:complete len:552 (+) Transcript_17445:225-1880(+)
MSVSTSGNAVLLQQLNQLVANQPDIPVRELAIALCDGDSKKVHSLLMRRARHNNDSEASHYHGNCRLTMAQELSLLSYITVNSSRCTPVTGAVVLRRANEAFGPFDPPLTRHWVRSFIQRHGERISNRVTNELAPERLHRFTYFTTLHWLSHVQNMIQTSWNWKDFNVLNIDEFVVRSAKASVHALTPARQAKTDSVSRRAPDITSLVPIVSAQGKVLLLVIVFKGHFTADGDATCRLLTKEQLEVSTPSVRSRRSYQIRYAITKTGNLNGELFGAIIDAFGEVWDNQYGHHGLECHLLCDRASPHSNATAIANAHRHKINLLYLPPNTTAWLQPLDRKVFGVLRLAANAQKREMERRLVIAGEEPYDCTLASVLRVFDRCFSIKNIKESFDNTGLVPFQPDHIKQETARATVTPLEVTDEPAIITDAREAAQQIFDAEYSRLTPLRPPAPTTTRLSKKALKARLHTGADLQRFREEAEHEKERVTFSKAMDKAFQRSEEKEREQASKRRREHRGQRRTVRALKKDHGAFISFHFRSCATDHRSRCASTLL